MNHSTTDFLNEDYGIYGWDLVNPFLQKLYGQQADEESNEEDDEGNDRIPSYSVPLPGENTNTTAFSPKYETPIPLKPNYPINPEPDTPPEEPRKLKSLTEGINLAGERIWNDLKYSRGYIQDKLSDDEMPDAASSALEHLPEYQKSSEAELRQKEDSLRNELEQRPSEQSSIELKGLKEYRRLRDEGLLGDEITHSLSETAKWGNEGRRIMEEARATENAFPETEGWASVGEMAANIARWGLPLAAGALAAPAGAAVGAANVASSVAESHAQAQMELDNFEQETGQKLSNSQRFGFVAICMGADLLFDTILQSRYLKNLKSGVKKRASDYFKKNILKNDAAQSEIKKLMTNLSKTDKSGLISGTFNDAITSGSVEALNSVAHDIATTIYNEPENYPTLESVLQNATTSMWTGGVTGAAVGGAGHVVNRRKRNLRRNRQESIAVLNRDGTAWEVLDYDPQSKIATVLSPDGKNTLEIERVEPDMIRSFSVKEYRDNQRITKEIDEPDPLGPVIPDPHKDTAWRGMSTRGKYRMVKDLAERMGLDNVIVYEHESDLPASLLSQKRGGGKIGGFFNHGNGEIGVVLDNIPNYESLQRVLLHEAVGHQGLDALFLGDSYFKDDFLMKVYRSMPAEWKLRGNSWAARKKDAEEYLADLASKGVSSAAWSRISGDLRNMLRIFMPGLKFSENEIRSMIIRSRDALKRDDSISEMRRKLLRQQASRETLGNPLSESSPEAYRYLWENDPEWQRYKRFYDEVYGEEPDTDE